MLVIRCVKLGSGRLLLENCTAQDKCVDFNALFVISIQHMSASFDPRKPYEGADNRVNIIRATIYGCFYRISRRAISARF